MKVLILFFLWCVLLVLAWPLAIAALIAAPFVLLVSLPFGLLFVTIRAMFALISAILFLPARLLGWRRCRC